MMPPLLAGISFIWFASGFAAWRAVIRRYGYSGMFDIGGLIAALCAGPLALAINYWNDSQ